MKCVLQFWTKPFFWNFCLSCSNTLKYYYKHTEGLHVNCLIFLSDFNKTFNFLTDLNKSIYCLQKFVRWESSCFMRADGQTRHSLIFAFRCFPNVPHKHVLLKAIRYPQTNRDSVVGVVTKPRVRWSGVRVPEGGKLFIFYKIIHNISGVHPASHSVCTAVFFPGSKVR